MLAEIRIEGSAIPLELRGKRARFAEVVHRALQRVRAGLRDDVDKSTSRSSEFRVRPLACHHHLLYCIQIECEGRPLAAALFAEERIVVVGSVDAHVIKDAALTGDREHVAVGALRHRNAWCEKGQCQKIATVIGQSAYHSGTEFGGCLRAGRTNGSVRFVADITGRQLYRATRQLERLADGGIDAHPQVFPRGWRISNGPHTYLIAPKRQQGRNVYAVRRCMCLTGIVGSLVAQRDRRIGNGVSGAVGDRAAYDAGGRRRLSVERRGQSESDDCRRSGPARHARNEQTVSQGGGLEEGEIETNRQDTDAVLRRVLTRFPIVIIGSRLR